MAGKTPKAAPTSQDAIDYVSSLDSTRRREEGAVLLELMRDATGVESVMWAPPFEDIVRVEVVHE